MHRPPCGSKTHHFWLSAIEQGMNLIDYKDIKNCRVMDRIFYCHQEAGVSISLEGWGDEALKLARLQ